MSDEAALSIERIKALLDYDPQTGIFVWLVKRGNKAAGAIADSVDGRGYIRIKIDGRDYRAHRLAWVLTYGDWPVDQLDHIDLDRKNNAIKNLRQANNSLNNANRGLQSNNRSGFKGVIFDSPRRKWRAEIKVRQKLIHLGRFETSQEAADAYRIASIKHFGEFSRTI